MHPGHCGILGHKLSFASKAAASGDAAFIEVHSRNESQKRLIPMSYNLPGYRALDLPKFGSYCGITRSVPTPKGPSTYI